jgi:hypothetical protein
MLLEPPVVQDEEESDQLRFGRERERDGFTAVIGAT